MKMQFRQKGGLEQNCRKKVVWNGIVDKKAVQDRIAETKENSRDENTVQNMQT